MSEEPVRTTYLKQMKEFKDRSDLVNRIAGIKISGKSTIMMQFGYDLRENG